MREHDFEDLNYQPARRKRKPKFDDERSRSGRMTEEERGRLARLRDEAYEQPEIPGGADRYSTWGDAEHGPKPRPDWVRTELAAVDTELGVLKSGKEADVHLIRRELPDGPGALLAAKRYRASEHRMFHRDAGYLEGRRMRRSREMRAIENRTSFGRNLIAEQWAVAEFASLSRLWTVGAPVPYPVQRGGTEVLLEFLGSEDGTAAPRLAQIRPSDADLDDLWAQAVEAMKALAAEGLAHGDLSAYNVLVHDGRLMLIDLPQVVDVVANPAGGEFLARDARNLAKWFSGRGVSIPPEADLVAELREVAGLA
ncbi:serine protein kinase RIO [Amycolatopsis sp. CA-230715]|uniref:serine protein kinase RIO n=1 Tax=Amycolatopsis sp. CA-230715 TaxID=2745196 RepID=UPI001C032B83|nr:RIO1 family regulatory kinase/ATPase [Amycolatopsis sp. CA-230715]QWF83054.1 hypothetical protein HUW46_06493 [Amycolatopsis sp. CA-230715]